MTYSNGPALHEILMQRICHDLVNPMGAAHNGFDLIKEQSDLTNNPEIIDFIGDSIKQSLYRLVLMRSALGPHPSGVTCDQPEFKKIIDDFLRCHSIDYQYCCSNNFISEDPLRVQKLRAVLMIILAVSSIFSLNPTLTFNFDQHLITITLTCSTSSFKESIAAWCDPKIDITSITATSTNIFYLLLNDFLKCHELHLAVEDCDAEAIRLLLTTKESTHEL